MWEQFDSKVQPLVTNNIYLWTDINPLEKKAQQSFHSIMSTLISPFYFLIQNHSTVSPTSLTSWIFNRSWHSDVFLIWFIPTIFSATETKIEKENQSNKASMTHIFKVIARIKRFIFIFQLTCVVEESILADMFVKQSAKTVGARSLNRTTWRESPLELQM